MVVFRPSPVERRKSGARNPTRKLVRREPAQRRKLTNAEKEIIKTRNKETRQLIAQALEKEHEEIWDRADALRLQYGLHTRKWWHDSIIQAPTKPKRVRSITRWLAYVSKRVNEINEEKRRAGENPVKSTDLSSTLSTEWKQLSDEEKALAVNDYIIEFEARRQEATTTIHNVSLKAFHDIRAQLDKWEDEADALSARTGVEVVFIAVRTDFEMYNKPYAWSTSPRTDDFFNHVFKSDLSKTALRMESYMLSGVSGLSQNYVQSFTQLKSDTAALIASKLSEAVGHEVSGMKYTNFHKHITIPHRLVIKGWPLTKFACPSDIGSKADLELLREAWTSGSCKFEKLTDEEYHDLCARMSATEPENADDHEDSTPSLPTPSTSPPPFHTFPSPASEGPAQPDAPSPAPAPTIPNASLVDTPPPPPAPTSGGGKRKRDPADPFVTVMGVNGKMVDVTKAPRKVRSDKGKPRGPRKAGKENINPAAVAPTPSTTPSLAATPTNVPVDS